MFVYIFIYIHKLCHTCKLLRLKKKKKTSERASDWTYGENSLKSLWCNYFLDTPVRFFRPLNNSSQQNSSNDKCLRLSLQLSYVMLDTYKR